MIKNRRTAIYLGLRRRLLLAVQAATRTTSGANTRVTSTGDIRVTNG